ncbi:putative protein kinase RLK-Pelle-CrRLK1L-1 family [Helianthus annuus]|nr:putative protein kinase RLK-Pelle-CrRLK1L-1 family [Helianthus annuus]
MYKKSGNCCFLSWEQQLKICVGVGYGLEYLHTGTGINEIVIHRDVKSSNILLDENWELRISDFGLCKKCVGNQPDMPIVASVKGTRGYMDPHYRKTGELSTKTDVYSFWRGVAGSALWSAAFGFCGVWSAKVVGVVGATMYPRRGCTQGY